MKTSTAVMLGVAVALAIGLSSTLAYANIWNRYGYDQGPQSFGPQYQGYATGMTGRYSGYHGYPGGMMGGNLGYPGGMMGGYGGTTGPWAASGGAVPGHCANYVRNYNYSWNYLATGSPVVYIVNYAFYPSSLTVAKGTTVTWVNMDMVPHTATSGSEAAPTSLFDSHELGHMQSFSFTFDTPGTYAYFCDLHPGMTGTITVIG